MVFWSLEKQLPVAGKVPSSPQHKKKTQEAQITLKNTSDKREAAVQMVVS